MCKDKHILKLRHPKKLLVI